MNGSQFGSVHPSMQSLTAFVSHAAFSASLIFKILEASSTMSMPTILGIILRGRAIPLLLLQVFFGFVLDRDADGFTARNAHALLLAVSFLQLRYKRRESVGNANRSIFASFRHHTTNIRN